MQDMVVATLSLAGGAEIVSDSNTLEHANPDTTLMTYGHVTRFVVRRDDPAGRVSRIRRADISL